MRTFVAVTLSPESRAALARLQRKLQATQADVKWVDPGQIHLTLKFMGEIEQSTAEQAVQVLDRITRRSPRFTMLLGQLGAFPSPGSPRVIWVGIDRGAQQLTRLAGDLDDQMAALSIPREERAFSSHITLGRTRSSRGRAALVRELAALKDYCVRDKLESPVASLTLFRSTLTPHGPMYEVLKECLLRGETNEE